MAKKAATRKKKSTAKPAKKKASKKTTSKAAKPSKKKATKKKSTKKKSPSAKSPAGLPKVGARVQWKSLPGMVFGKVIAVLRKNSELNGKPVKASPDKPRIKLQSDNGKICVHKPESVKPAK